MERVLALALGLGSSLCWGVSDFFGGLQARRLPLLPVMLVSQLAGAVGLPALVVASGDAFPGFERLWPGLAAGAGGTIALACFYRAMAIGTMSIVAPVASTGAAIPVAVGIAGGEQPAALQLAGMLAAMVGVALASRESHEDAQRAADARRSLVLALVAAVGFGAYFVGLGAAASASVPWALMVSRTVSTVLLAATVWIARPPFGATSSSLVALGLIGLLDVSANGLYALATRSGLLSVVGVLASLYPVITVLLARALLGERVRRVQEVGIVTAVAGVALIGAG